MEGSGIKGRVNLMGRKSGGNLFRTKPTVWGTREEVKIASQHLPLSFSEKGGIWVLLQIWVKVVESGRWELGMRGGERRACGLRVIREFKGFRELQGVYTGREYKTGQTTFLEKR